MWDALSTFVLLLIDGSPYSALSYLHDSYQFFKEKLPCHVSLNFCLFPWSVPTSLTDPPCYRIHVPALSHSMYIASICLSTGLSLQDIANFLRAGTLCIILPYDTKAWHIFKDFQMLYMNKKWINTMDNCLFLNS